MVCEHPKRKHEESLCERSSGLHALCGNRTRGGISHRDARSRHRVAKETEHQALSPASIRRKLSALSDLFDPVRRKRHHAQSRKRCGAPQGRCGETPALSDAQAKRLLAAPPPETLKGKRDRAILAVLLYHALRRAELCSLRVKDYAVRRGVQTLSVHGKGGKMRVPSSASGCGASRGISRCRLAPV